MTDYDDDPIDDLPDDEVEEPKPKKNWRRELEAQARRAKELEAELATVRRQQAVKESGLDTSDPRTKFFLDNYQGEPTADAIKQAAQTAGFLTPPEPEVPAEEFQALERMSHASGGATPVSDLDAALNELNSAQSPEEVMALLAKHVPEARITTEAPGRWLYGATGDAGAVPRS